MEDADEDSVGRLIDRLMEKQAFGEHWARKWLDLARDEVDATLDLKDVFPDTNTGDWEIVDAPSQAVTTLQNAYTGLDADITTLETEMDAVEASVATKQDTIVRSGTCYVDAKRSDSYTEDGTISKPTRR